MRWLSVLVMLWVACAAACSDDGDAGSSPTSSGGGAGAGSAGGGQGGGGATGGGATGGGGTGCELGQRSCLDTEHERLCEDQGDGPQWVERACDPYHYCVDDRCVAACLDECALGATRTEGGSQQTCGLYSETDQAFVAPGTGMHDLSRLHDAWMRVHQLANGYVAEALHTDTTYAAVDEYWGTVDAAEWTGTYLAAESLRLLTTRSPDAERSVQRLVERIHQLFDITGEPGSMARIWAPMGVDPVLDKLYDGGDWSHHLTTYQGDSAYWHGWTSRDMYAGATLGLGLAYDALSSESHRQLIRTAVMGLALELIEERSDVPVTVRFHFAGDWVEQTLAFDMQHVVLVPGEMVDGTVFIQIGSDASPSDYVASELIGAREFLPNFTSVLGQTPLIGGLLPPVPRPGSAIMLASFMRLALHVSEGVAELADDRLRVEEHYLANRDGWLDVMKQYAYHHADNCWQQYFGMTIAFHPAYNLIRLEPDSPFKTSLQQDMVAARMWPIVAGHHNAYFDFIAASQGPAGLVPPATLQETAAQLAGFVAPPKARVLVDNSSYGVDAGCNPPQAATVVDVHDRVPSDFIFQHHPFDLTTAGSVEPRLVYASADYLVAYWLGRHHAFIADDAPDTCTRWEP